MDHCNGLIHYQDICHYLGAHFDNIKKNAWRSGGGGGGGGGEAAN